MKPLISVKIPTYNCAEYLIQTIKSILDQKDFDLDLLDIEVIDDCSTKDNPELVVNEFGDGRIKFFRQHENVGAIENFNTCISRSNCEWIHILHGDDIISELFYYNYLECIKYNETVKFISSRVSFINKQSQVIWVQPEFNLPTNVPFKTNELINGNVFSTPSVLIKKNVYDSIGVFKPFLNHTADWEMWSRVIFFNDAFLINKVLCSWRDFEDSDTKKVRKNGDEIKDHFNAVKEISYVYKLTNYSNKIPMNIGIRNCYFFIQSKDYNSFYNNYLQLYKILSLNSIIKITIKFIVFYIKSTVKRFLQNN